MDSKKKVSRFEFAIMQAAGIDQTNVEPKTKEEETQERIDKLRKLASQIRFKKIRLMDSKTETVSDNDYFRFHRNLIKKYGKASKCEHCASSFAKRYEWSLKKGHQYSDDSADYLQLCVSCHRLYDYTDEQRKKQSIAKMGQPAYVQKPVSQYSLDGDFIKTFSNAWIAAKETGTNKICIYHCIAGRHKTANNFIWKRATMS